MLRSFIIPRQSLPRLSSPLSNKSHVGCYRYLLWEKKIRLFLCLCGAVGKSFRTCTRRNKTFPPSTSLPVMGEIAGVNTASLDGYFHRSKTRARWAEGFHDEPNGHVFDMEMDGLRQVVPCPWLAIWWMDRPLEFAKSQRAVENREQWRKLVVKSSVVLQRPSWLSDWWW